MLQLRSPRNIRAPAPLRRGQFMIGGRLLRVIHHALVALVVVSSIALLSAQAVVDPRFVEFTASADHNALTEEGDPIVTSYSLAIHALGSSTPLTTVDLGKPDPDASNVIRVDFLPLLQIVLAPAVNYEARVSARGPGGSGTSTVSNSFSFAPPPCAPTIAPIARTVGQAAGLGTVAVTAGTGCGWTAQSNASWITLTGGTSGSGNGSVAYSITANPDTIARVGTVTIAGHTFTLTQSALGCSYSISPTSRSFTAAAGSSTTSVTAPAGCAWTAATNDPGWLTISSGASGNGNAAVTFAASANTATQSRTGTLTVAGHTLTVTQAAAACAFTVSPTSRTILGSGGSSSTSVTTTSGCGWTAASNSSWITITDGASRTGSGSVNFTVAPNQSGARSGSLTVAGQTVTISQNASSCTYSISPASRNVHAGGTTNSVQLTTITGCSWTASSDVSWVTVSPSSGGGSRAISYTVAANPSSAGRTARVTVGGQVHTVNQNGATAPGRPANPRVTGVNGGQ